MKPWHIYALWGAVMVLLLSASTLQYLRDSWAEGALLQAFYDGCREDGLRPEGWPGWGLRNNVPRDLPWPRIHPSVEQLYRFRELLMAAG